MSWELITFGIVLPSLVYMAVAGLVSCVEYSINKSHYGDDVVAALFAGLLWPVAWLIVLPRALERDALQLPRRNKLNRKQQQSLEYEREMVKIQQDRNRALSEYARLIEPQ